MGNGQGLKSDEGVLTLEMLEEAAQKMMNNFGKPTNPIIFMPPVGFAGWEQHPQYHGTPWAMKDRLSKREHKLASLHVFLKKLNILKNMTDEEFEEVYKKSIKRLKRSKWAGNLNRRTAL